ncbi:MAG TPA: hypothetical protein VIJ46_05615 [Rhabdochlamydiaceae bacterium]
MKQCFLALVLSVAVLVRADIHVAERIDDPVNDDVVKSACSSEKCVSQVLHYRLGDDKYQVRILYNPEGKPYTATKSFRLDHWKPASDFTITWDYKYGIITDKAAPQELIDYLSTLTNASYWDWYFNFKVCNGTYVKHVKKEYIGPNSEWVTTYELDTWFNYTTDLVLKSDPN